MTNITDKGSDSPTQPLSQIGEKKPKSVMVWVAIFRKGKTPLMFVEQGVKIDRYDYMDMLRKHLLP
jgi:hypothetical protein